MIQSLPTHIAISLLALSALTGSQLWAASPSPADSLQALRSSGSFRELREIPGVAVDLRYASTNNFMHANVYGDFNRAFLHRDAFAKLAHAAALLQERRPGYQLLILDALRPRSVQWELWDSIHQHPPRGTDRASLSSYVADPRSGSIHNFGLAVDLTVIDKTGRELPMGTDYDDFSELAQPRHESRLFAEGQLKRAHLENRALLRSVMEAAGFRQLPSEWWHFDAVPAREVRATGSPYRIVE